MKILITGGLGYVGGRLTRHLRNLGHELTITTLETDYLVPEDFSDVDVATLDIFDTKRLEELCEGQDYIIHLVAVNEHVSIRNPQLAIDVNVKGTQNLLDVASRVGVKKLMYFSTFHVYGPVENQVISEDRIPNPVHPYSTTHYMAELLFNQFKYRNHLETTIVRLSNSFGAPTTPDVDRWTLLVNDLCYQAVKEKKLVLKSSGAQHRDFIPLCDVARGVGLLVSTPYEKLGNGLFNLGSGKSFSVLEMCEKIQKVYQELYQQEIPIVIPKDATKDNPVPVQYNISKIQALGFKPSFNFEEEMMNTLKVSEEKMRLN